MGSGGYGKLDGTAIQGGRFYDKDSSHMDEMMKAQIMDICRDKASCNMTFEAGRAVVIETITVIAAAVALACFFEYMARRPVKSTDDHSGGADVG